MKTILLLGGVSKRFWPLREKLLFPLVGKPLISHQLERLRAGGCKDILVVVGEHNRTALRPFLEGTTVVTQKEPGMRGALLAALPKCGTDPVMVIGGSDVIDPSAYRDLRTLAGRKGLGGALLTQKVSRYFPGGYLTLKGKRITGIVEKPKPGKEPSNLVNIVAHVHNHPRELLALLKETRVKTDDGYEQALEKLLGTHIYEALRYDSDWLAVKYPWHILPLLTDFLGQLKPRIDRTATVHKTAVIEGVVVLEEGVKVLPHATIVGPAAIGRHSLVGTGALVRGSSVGEHCVIGYNTEVKSSALADHVWTHSTYIGDSVIGNNVSFGAGSVTGNLRLDEGEIHSAVADDRLPTGLAKFGTVIGDDVRVGIHVGVNPGVKIGTGTFVGSGTLVTGDVPDQSFVKMKAGEMQIRKNSVAVPQPEGREKYKKSVHGK